jgi:hypothetical protein
MISYNDNKQHSRYRHDAQTDLETLIILEDFLYSGGSVVVILSDLEKE